ncbi:MAG: HIT domain-containing protein [Actinomycetota bacterium]|nr:HIT domain-containing protein [Actinomycetota bacterium]
MTTPPHGEPPLVEQQGTGTPDGFARLWTPHRLAYIKGDEGDPESAAGTAAATAPSCPFCHLPSLGDREALIVARGAAVYLMLNLYPYNPGHLMVVPYRHIADYTELTEEELAEFSDFTRRALTVIRTASNPDGFNVGINAGAAAGAGIAHHLHQHVVPRWSADANFMPVIGQTRVLPQLLATTRDELAALW